MQTHASDVYTPGWVQRCTIYPPWTDVPLRLLFSSSQPASLQQLALRVDLARSTMTSVSHARVPASAPGRQLRAARVAVIPVVRW